MPQKSRSTRGRFSAKRKRDAVLRLIRGETLDAVGREMGMKPSTLASWRESFLESGLAGLSKKAKDPRDEQISHLQRKLGMVTMDNGLLNAKIDRMEAGLPLARR